MLNEGWDEYFAKSYSQFKPSSEDVFGDSPSDINLDRTNFGNKMCIGGVCGGDSQFFDDLWRDSFKRYTDIDSWPGEFSSQHNGFTSDSFEQSKYVFLDDKSTIDESKLAWWVMRYKSTEDRDSGKYNPFPTPGFISKHWGIQLADGRIVGFFPDKKGKTETDGVVWDDSLKHKWDDSVSAKQFYERIKAQDLFEVGFNNEVMITALKSVENKWAAAGIKYKYLKYDCHVFVYHVFDEYRKIGGTIYYKKVSHDFDWD